MKENMGYKVFSIKELDDIKAKNIEGNRPYGKKGCYMVTVHLGTCGIASGADEIQRSVLQEINKRENGNVIFSTSGCVGFCALEPMMTIEDYKGEKTTYHSLKQEDVASIFSGHIDNGKILYELNPIVKDSKLAEFYDFQVSRVLHNRGRIDPFKIDDYISFDGYRGLLKSIEMDDPESIIGIISDSGLRGRGGAGFPTGRKWEFCRRASSDDGIKYVVCNGDEGDPGAFMDRNLLESDPHSVLEGMIIAGLAIGANKGYIYVRAEYPLAIKTLSNALKQSMEYGFVGKNILGSRHDFDIEIYQGAGAFVCGEETALLKSIEGKRGMPRPKPPFPANEGLFGKPTLINNVETFSNVPQIILNGAEWFNEIGTKDSKGTKIFALTGAVNNVGLVEVPMGIPVRDIIYKIGGGIKGDKKFKAVQLGGPSGGCLPEQLLDLPVDYEEVKKAGAIMGSGGMIVLDEDQCMVDLARYFMDFIQDESCGQCTPCRVGTRRMLEILTRITEGTGEEGDIEKLVELAEMIKETSLCGLGKTAPNPVLSTIRYFRDEYQEHIDTRLSCKRLHRKAKRKKVE
jgi:NADH-quinone oxidoreductase subunit F